MSTLNIWWGRAPLTR
ncbi:MAG: hypothetical protein HY684_00675 [Chloroflexi bacterium]|nr:hypothetical protein [Chloroflexota bacterium]